MLLADGLDSVEDFQEGLLEVLGVSVGRFVLGTVYLEGNGGGEGRAYSSRWARASWDIFSRS